MKVVFDVSMAGLDHSFHGHQLAEIDDEWAEKLISSGICHKASQSEIKNGGALIGPGANDRDNTADSGAAMGNAARDKAPEQDNSTGHRAGNGVKGKTAHKS